MSNSPRLFLLLNVYAEREREREEKKRAFECLHEAPPVAEVTLIEKTILGMV